MFGQPPRGGDMANREKKSSYKMRDSFVVRVIENQFDWLSFPGFI